MARTDVRNATRFWADPAYPALSFIEADFTTHGYANHAHGVYVFATTESGSSQFSARGTTDYARGDALLAFAPGQPHATCMGSSGRWAYRGLYVATRRMVELAGVFGHRHVPEFTDHMLRDAELVSRFRTLHATFDRPSDRFERDGRLYEAFELLFARHAGVAASHGIAARADAALVRRVVDAMHARFAENLSLDELSASVERSPFQLIRSFNRVMGISPHSYLTQLRLWNAARMMRRGEPMAEVAVAVGFYDQSALSKHFKRAFGITPYQYLVGMAHVPAPSSEEVLGPGIYRSRSVGLD